MEIRVLEKDGYKILEVHGDVKFTNWQEIVMSANEIVNDGHENLIISWENVGYMDSSALGALVTIHKVFKRLPNGKSVVFTSREEHHFVFQQTHFHTFLNIFDNLESALGYMADSKDVIEIEK